MPEIAQGTKLSNILTNHLPLLPQRQYRLMTTSERGGNNKMRRPTTQEKLEQANRITRPFENLEHLDHLSATADRLGDHELAIVLWWGVQELMQDKAVCQ